MRSPFWRSHRVSLSPTVALSIMGSQFFTPLESFTAIVAFPLRFQLLRSHSVFTSFLGIAMSNCHARGTNSRITAKESKGTANNSGYRN
jgi:hypothetical protein